MINRLQQAFKKLIGVNTTLKKCLEDAIELFSNFIQLSGRPAQQQQFPHIQLIFITVNFFFQKLKKCLYR